MNTLTFLSPLSDYSDDSLIQFMEISRVNYKTNTVERHEYYGENLFPLEWVTHAVEAARTVFDRHSELDRLEAERLAKLRPSMEWLPPGS